MRNAFSLVELSIVLVIIGLLTGGILTGRSLIHAAELRAVMTEIQTYQTAAKIFKEQYFELPGDMSDATDYWGAMTNCAAANPSGTGTQTCNGDGDGTLDGGSGASQTGERFGFWQHLANAGLIAGKYTGIAGAGGAQHHITGENAAQSRRSNGGYMAYTLGAFGGTTIWYAGDHGNAIRAGIDNGSGGPNNPLFTPKEAWKIDKKMDDGRPAYGKVIAAYWDDACTDATAKTDFDSDYKLSDTSLQCILNFVHLY